LDQTSSSTPLCVPNTAAPNVAVTCSTDIDNVTGFTAPSGKPQLTFNPSYGVYTPLCVTQSPTRTHCTVTYSAPTAVGPVTATASFHDPAGFYADSDSGPATIVLVVN
jgi:hypothetical protein